MGSEIKSIVAMGYTKLGRMQNKSILEGSFGLIRVTIGAYHEFKSPI